METVFTQIQDQDDAEREKRRNDTIRRKPSGLKLANPVCLLCFNKYWVTDDYPNLEYCPVCAEAIEELCQAEE